MRSVARAVFRIQSAPPQLFSDALEGVPRNTVIYCWTERAAGFL